MSSLQNFQKLKDEILENIKIVVVTKTVDNDSIIKLHEYGHKIFGENKVQELTEKHKTLSKDIEWHMIGHLQSNKVKFIAPFVSLIHSVDSFKLLKAINKEAVKNNRVIDCLLQMHIAKEKSKFGLSIYDIEQLFKNDELKSLNNIRITGLMGMATFTDDLNMVRSEFKLLANTFHELKENYFSNNDTFCHLSMGMSADYKIAIEEGATIVRLGSVIFGERTYN